LGGISDGE